MHRSFMDEKDRIITAIYNDTRARARSVPALFCPLFTVLAPPSRIPVRPPLCSLLQGQQSQAPAGATAEAAAAATTCASPRPRNLAPKHQPLSSSPGWGLLCFLRDSPLPKMHAIKWFSALVSDSLLQVHHPQPWPSLGTVPRPPGSGGSGGDPGARPPGRCVPFPLLRREGVCGEGGSAGSLAPHCPRPAPAPRPGGERVSGSHEPPARQPGPGPLPPPPSPPPPPAARHRHRPPGSSGHRRCAALPAPRAREGAAEEPPPAPGPRPPRPSPRHGALAAAAPGSAGLGRCGRLRRAAPAGTMSPLLRRLLLAALLQLAPAQVRASPTSRPPAVPSLKVGGSWGGVERPRLRGSAGQVAIRVVTGVCSGHPRGDVLPCWPASPAPGPLPRPTPSPGLSWGRSRLSARKTWLGAHCTPF